MVLLIRISTPKSSRPILCQVFQYLSQLWQKYCEKMTPKWAIVEGEVETCIHLSQSLTFHGKRGHISLALRGWV